jgi:hypothetical protein
VVLAALGHAYWRFGNAHFFPRRITQIPSELLGARARGLDSERCRGEDPAPLPDAREHIALAMRRELTAYFEALYAQGL